MIKEMMMDAGYLFLSYAQADQIFVDELNRLLNEVGLRAWWFVEHQVAPESYTEQLMTAIDGAQAVVVILSCDSVKSRSVLKEVLHASDRRKRIITVLREDCDGPLRFHLGPDHWVDARNGRNPVPKLLEALAGRTALPLAPLAELLALEEYEAWVRPHTLTLTVPQPIAGRRPATSSSFTICTIGRHPEQRLSIHADKVRVSKLHAIIRAQITENHTWQFLLNDGAEQPSRNGTFINGERLAFGVPRPLEPYDLIGLAGEDVVLRFLCSDTTQD